MRSTAIGNRRGRFLLSIVLVVLVFAAFAATAAAQDGPPSFAGRPLYGHMTGANEAPNPGDPDGSGGAFFWLNAGQERICYELSVTGIEAPTAAHIHRAPAGVPGQVVVPLVAPANGFSSGCVTVDRTLIREILVSPEAFYVNVHNATYPGGALRDQLHR